MAVVIEVRSEPVKMETPASPTDSLRSASPLSAVMEAYSSIHNLRTSSSSTRFDESPSPDLQTRLEVIAETPTRCCGRLKRLISRVWQHIDDLGDRHPFLRSAAGSAVGGVVAGTIVWAIFYKDSCR